MQTQVTVTVRYNVHVPDCALDSDSHLVGF